MAAEDFNSLGGYSVGIPPVPVVDANGNVVTNLLNTTGNVSVANVYAANYYYANGQPFNAGGNPLGPNFSVQYNNNGVFGGNSAFLYDNANNLVTVPSLKVNGLANLGPVGNVTITGGSTGYLLTTDGNGVLQWSPPGSGAAISNGNSNVNIATSNGNITAGVGGVANVVTISTTGLDVIGNITATNFVGNFSGNASNANFANTAGTVTASAQPNITSVGTLVSLEVSGNITANAVKTNQLLYANGDPYQFTTNAAGSNTEVQFNNNNAFSASANFTFNTGTNTLSVTNITANGAGLSSLTGANVTGEVAFANTANSVAVANVVGIGNIATVNLDGNVSNVLRGDGTFAGEAGNLNANYANFAGEAFSVNVSNIVGTVNLANFATTANAVAGANVSGEVANATYALSSNVANTAGTVTTNAQPNITSVGTLTGLTVAGNILPNANLTYNLGSPTQRWKDLYISGNTIDLNGSTITSDANGITLTNPLGGSYTVIGTGASNTASIVNGNSSLVVNPNSNVSVSITGTSNVIVVSIDGLLVNGNGNITGNLVTGGTIVASANITGANLITSNGIYANTANITANLTSGNASLGNLATANYVNVSQEINGNIANFSGNLTSLNANLGNLAIANFINTGHIFNGNSNITLTPNGNITTTVASNATLTVSGVGANIVGYVQANGIISAGSFEGVSLTSNVGNLTLYAAPGNNYVELRPSGNGQVDVGNFRITSLAEPNLATDAATKQYVDTVAQGLHIHTPSQAATPDTLANVTSGVITYNNGASGVGANLVTTGSFNLIDGVNVQTIGTRILVKNEANTAHNGIYTWANASTIVRAIDFDTPTEMAGGDFTFVQQGTLYNDTGWVMTDPVTTVGTSPVIWVQFSGAGTYSAGPGLTLNGTQFSVNVDNLTTEIAGGNVVVKANSQFTTPNIGAATGTSLNLTGNISANNITVIGNSNLGNVTNVHITGGTAGYVLGTDGSGNLSWISGGNISGVIANNIALGTPSDSDLTTNVAYNGWTTSTYVTDGLDDLNQVSLNIAGNTFVGNIYIGANVTSGPSPLSVAFTGNYIGNPTNYLWNFGDGTTSTTRNPTKTYSNVLGGQFTVTFTAYNVNGTYGGNAANGAKGSTATSTNTNFITLFTPLPIPSFTTSPTSLDTGSNVTLTNTSLYATSYTINYGDGNTAVNPGNSWTTDSHQYNNSANVDTIYGINLTGTNQTAGNAPPYSVTTANTNVKVYSPQSPAFTANTTSTINYLATSGGVISFRNDTPGSPGNTASFGAQQLYNYRWGDGTANSNINIQTGLAGNPGAANITHAFALSSVQQNAATTVNYVANLSLYTGFSTSPFISSNITITVEPEVRANFTGTANTQTDATGYTSNAQVGYLFTDYLGRDRSLFNFSNDTSPNVSFTGNLFNWTWGDTTSNTGLTSRANITHSYLNDYGSPTTGGKTVALQANGTPGTTLQSNTNTKTNYITILANPTAPANLSSFTNVTIATTSQGTSPLLAAGAADNTGGNILANGTAVTRVATTTPVSTSTQVTNANTALTGTLTAFVNNTASGNITFSTGGNAVGTYSSLIVSADRDLHVANAAVPTGFYKVFSATISNTLASLGNGYNDFQLRHSTTGNTNTIGMVKDNLNSAPSLVTTNTAMVTATSGTFRYISGIPYYSATGSPAITVSNLELQNFTGQTFRSADPFTVASGTSYEGSGSVIATQTKSLAQVDNSSNSMLTGSNVKANIGISTNYSMGNLNVLLNGAVNGVSTLAANIFNVVGTSTTIQLPTKIQMYAGANSGFNEANITANVASNTQPAIRVVLSSAGNTPAFSGSINYYTSNAWSGAQTIAGTPEAVVRYGVLKHYAVDLSNGYLPVGPDLATGRSGLQYFTLAFVRPSLANFDIILTTGSTGISGLWVAAPGTTIDTGGFSAPVAGAPGPTSTINGWLTGYEQYNGAGVPGNSATGGNPAGTNGCALTGSDVIPLNTQISNVRYTMTLGSQNQANSFGNNILIRIALAAGQTITDLQIGVAT